MKNGRPTSPIFRQDATPRPNNLTTLTRAMDSASGISWSTSFVKSFSCFFTSAIAGITREWEEGRLKLRDEITRRDSHVVGDRLALAFGCHWPLGLAQTRISES